jgi:hypothetical protein
MGFERRPEGERAEYRARKRPCPLLEKVAADARKADSESVKVIQRKRANSKWT